MRNIVSVIFVLLFSISVFSQAGGSISGTVYFAGDNSVMHNVTVRISELKLTALTDDVGHYQFKNVPPGRYTLISHQEGFGDSTQKVDVTAGNAASADFQLTISGVKEQVTVSATGSEENYFRVHRYREHSRLFADYDACRGRIRRCPRSRAGHRQTLRRSGNSRPVIRGFDGDRVKITTDGVTSGSLASQSGDHAEPVDIFSAERIEVVKGPAIYSTAAARSAA